MVKLVMIFCLCCVSFQISAMGESSAKWIFEKQNQCETKINSLKKDIQINADNLTKGNYNEAIVTSLTSSKYKYIQEKCRFEYFESIGTEAETLNICSCLIDEYTKFNEYLVEKINLP
ncbi:hypothetical protein [Vibrio sinaloensis]|uniref:hypothetical protein n=1 Tax=Photobacterium sp. (strain ATCC 43367) TaxID=379097 RepID=UPI0022AFC6A7|nr:hypothetical protein [Vibrio sinaloensis]MCZ4293414.1 hypothetical protein [Vibrio sinaloensis]